MISFFSNRFENMFVCVCVCVLSMFHISIKKTYSTEVCFFGENPKTNLFTNWKWFGFFFPQLAIRYNYDEIRKQRKRYNIYFERCSKRLFALLLSPFRFQTQLHNFRTITKFGWKKNYFCSNSEYIIVINI